MSMELERARQLLRTCDLPTLFVEELGWEPSRQKLVLKVGDADYNLVAIAGSKGIRRQSQQEG